MHVLALQRCVDCGSYQWTPKMACSQCLAERLEWVRSSGRGLLYSYTIVHRAPTEGFTTPYVLAIVELEEGPRILTEFVGELGGLRINLPVEVSFEDAGDVSLYKFKPRRSA